MNGKIFNYLIEKSRIIYQAADERNFHIFYQLLAGADDPLLAELGLVRDLNAYSYLSNGDAVNTDSDTKKDKDKFESIFQSGSLASSGIDADLQKDLFKVISAVLHLGNIKFYALNIEVPNMPAFGISDDIGTQNALDHFCQLLGLSKEAVSKALLHKKIHVHSVENVESPVTVEQAYYARDSFAKNIYERVFEWIISTLNHLLMVLIAGYFFH